MPRSEQDPATEGAPQPAEDTTVCDAPQPMEFTPADAPVVREKRQPARESGLRFLQQDVLDQRNAVLGNQRNFADTVNAYIEKKLATE